MTSHVRFLEPREASACTPCSTRAKTSSATSTEEQEGVEALKPSPIASMMGVVPLVVDKPRFTPRKYGGFQRNPVIENLFLLENVRFMQQMASTYTAK